jgi:type II secretory pathway pseudopilin PulG
MKTRRSSSGSTLIEMMVTVAIVATAGASFFWVLYGIMVLGAKNNAVDFSHQNARILINHAVQQIHSSISIPALVDANLVSVSGNGPAAGVTYQSLVAGPGSVSTTAAPGQKKIQITMAVPPTSIDPTGAYTQTPPAVGMRFLLPSFELEDNITAVTGSWPNFTVTLTNNIPSGMAITTNGTSPNYQVYYSYRSALIVNNGFLLYYPDTSKATGTVATDITSGYATKIVSNITTATPFSVPGGNNAEIQVTLATNEPTASARGFFGVNFQTTLTIPYRFRLATYQ